MFHYKNILRVIGVKNVLKNDCFVTSTLLLLYECHSDIFCVFVFFFTIIQNIGTVV